MIDVCIGTPWQDSLEFGISHLSECEGRDIVVVVAEELSLQPLAAQLLSFRRLRTERSGR